MRCRHLTTVSIVGLLLLAGSGAGTLARGADCGGGTPCACGDRVTASRTLVCGVDPVTVGTCPHDGLSLLGNVTLNLGGCTIAGDGGGTGIFIDELKDFVAVQSGTITGFRTGVRALDTIGSTVANLQVYGNHDGIEVRASSSTIRANIVGPNSGDGVHLRNGTKDDDANLVSSNRADGNEGRGFVIRGSMNTVSNNVSLRSGDCGFDVAGNGNTLKQNRSEQSPCAGFLVDGARHTFSLNHSLRNGLDGYSVFSSDTVFDRNRADYNGGFGISDFSVDGGTSGTTNIYTGNKCSANGEGKSDPPGLCQ